MIENQLILMTMFPLKSNSQKFQVKVHMDSNGSHLHQIFCGLYDLEAKGIIKLSFGDLGYRKILRHTRQLLLIKVWERASGNEAICCFDMNDSGEIASAEALSISTIYFKRSFSPAFLKDLSINLAGKVRPFGLNYRVVSHFQHGIIKRILKEVMLHHPALPLSDRGHLNSLLRWIRDHWFKNYPRREYLPTSSFEVHPGVPLKPGIFFQCRLWDPAHFPVEYRNDIQAINDSRVSVINALHRNFPGRFFGGLQYNEYAQKYFKELISDFPQDRPGYLRAMHPFLISIATKGISDSIGGKFGEYVAASKCIVSEPLAFKIPGNFSQPQNYIEFNDSNSCLQACEKLLLDPCKANAMREANFQYYLRYVKPDSLILNCLIEAFKTYPNNFLDLNNTLQWSEKIEVTEAL